MQNLAIELKNITLKHGKQVVLNAVNLAIKPGEFIGVLGPNGAGKTTLLHALLGLINPALGHIKILNKSVFSGNPAIGYLPQTQQNLNSLQMTGENFVASACEGHIFFRPWLNRQAKNRIYAALNSVNALDLANKPLSLMSGGEIQRLLLAQCLVDKPAILLLDEPLSHLDPGRQHMLINLVKKVCAELKMTVLFTAHELNPLIGVIDRVLYLGNQHAALGTVDEVITAPVLSKLYNADIQVIKMEGQIFVMSGKHFIEKDTH